MHVGTAGCGYGVAGRGRRLLPKDEEDGGTLKKTDTRKIETDISINRPFMETEQSLIKKFCSVFIFL